MVDRHVGGTHDEGKRLWSLFMLELWHREFSDGVLSSPALQAAA
jgi:hypothetical protein